MESIRQKELKKLQERLGICFQDIELLNKALMHSSYVNEHKDERDSNERLELLGDSVLGLIVSEYLYKNYEDREGELSRMKAVVVSEYTLAQLGRRLSIGSYILLGRGEKLSDGVNRDSLLEDTVEALIGAYYIDSGLEKTRNFILPYIEEEVKKAYKESHRRDYKTLLQHQIQELYKICPTYATIWEEGPDHKKLFCVEVRVKGESLGKGYGKSKRDAQQDAARNTLNSI